MIKREKGRLLPERATVLEIDLPGMGAHHMRVPSPLKIAKLARCLDQNQVKALAIMVGGIEDLTPASLLAVTRHVGPEMLQAAGCLIGWGWLNLTYDLETDSKLAPLEYGDGVFEELHADGYDLGLLLLLAVKLAWEVADAATIDDEALDRLGFSSRQKAQPTSSSLTSESTILETPGDTAT